MKTKISIFVLALFSVIINSNAQSNKYVWIHGLNGTADSWNVYQNTLTPNNGTRPEYISDKSITEIAEGYWSKNNDKFGRNTILIGHSMGGLVARELERNHSSSIKGIITIGTGHQGAPVAKELKNGKLDILAKNIYNRATTGIRASIDAIVTLFIGIPLTRIAPISNEINNLVAEYNIKLGDEINNNVDKMFNASLLDDLSPNSTFLTTLEQRKINVPILTFACEEDRWQLARTTYCQIKYKELATSPNINSNGDFDMVGYNTLNDITNGILGIKEAHTTIANICDVVGFFFSQYKVAASFNRIAANNWQNTANYFNNGLDYDHAVLIGAVKYENRTIGYQNLVCNDGLTAAELVKGKQRIQQPTDCYYETFYRTYTVAVPEPHDGIVPVKSQQLDKSKGTNVIWANTTIKGVNHMEERNHKNTRKEFDDVLSGRSYAPDIFKK